MSTETPSAPQNLGVAIHDLFDRQIALQQMRGERNHLVLHREHSSWKEDVDGGRNFISGSDTYYMLKCAGCDEVQLRHESLVLGKLPG